MQKFPPTDIEAIEQAVLEEVSSTDRQYKVRELIEHLARNRELDPELVKDAVWHLTDRHKLTFDRDWQLSPVNELHAQSR